MFSWKSTAAFSRKLIREYAAEERKYKHKKKSIYRIHEKRARENKERMKKNLAFQLKNLWRDFG